MEKRTIANSELVLTPEGKVYHLKLGPGDIADTIFLVGDPGRVRMMSSLFDRIEFTTENREFVTHTGTYRNKRLSVISTGIGTDNIDIVVNELDALANINLDTRRLNSIHKRLRLIRIGTSGALHADIEPGNVILSRIAGGLDNLMYFYGGSEKITDGKLAEEFASHMNWNPSGSRPYFVHAADTLIDLLREESWFSGITLSAPGFYAPQGRSLRIGLADPEYITKVSSFQSGALRINNFEMEGSALYGLSRLLGHEALTICIALANRITGRFITDYKSYMQELLELVLSKIAKDEEND